MEFWEKPKETAVFFFPPDVASLSLSVVIQISNSAQQVRAVEEGNGQENPKVLFHSEQNVDIIRFPRRRSKLERRQGKREEGINEKSVS